MGLLTFLFMALVLAYLTRWVVAGMGSGARTEIEARHTAELARLREEVDQLQAQVLRLTDEQTFLTQLLAEGGGRPAGALPPEAGPDTPNPEKS